LKSTSTLRALRLAMDGSTAHRGMAELIPSHGCVVMVEG